MATKFQESVWKAIALIPRGKVTTYGEIAKYMGSNAVRAIGTAVGKNPYAPEVPCHRVVLSSGRIGNYSGGNGTPVKISLLSEEGVSVKDGKIVNFDDIFYSFESPIG